MEKFTNNILSYIRRHGLIRRGDAVTVGFSGGADSVCLLTVLHDLRRLLGIRLQAVHVNHGLRGAEAERDEMFCRQFAAALGVPFRAVSVDVRGCAERKGLTEEEAGRGLRYAELERLAAEFAAGGTGLSGHPEVSTGPSGSLKAGTEPFGLPEGGLEPSGSTKAVTEPSDPPEPGAKQDRGIVAVAHHADDQAETILLNLLRGSGLRGMAGMKPRRGNIVRPLLGTGRDDIIAFIRARGLAYVDDSTNFENDHTRNRLRNIILPELREAVNERAAEHIALTGVLIGEADAYLAAEAAAYLDAAYPDAADLRTEGQSICPGSGAGECAEAGTADVCIALDRRELAGRAPILRRYIIMEALRRLGVPLKDWGGKHFSDIDAALTGHTGIRLDLPGGVRAENTRRHTLLRRPV